MYPPPPDGPRDHRRKLPRSVVQRPTLESIDEKEVEFAPATATLPRPAHAIGVNYDPYVWDEEGNNVSAQAAANSHGCDAEPLRDKYGFALFPQPLDDPKDPLTWTKSLKLRILIQVSLHSLISHFSAFVISPALWPLHNDLHVSLIDSSYLVGTFVLFLGVSPLLWNPLSHSLGRRPLLIAGLTGSVLSSVACGFSRSYALMMAFRAVHGVFAGAAIGLGSVIICDIYYQHQRGLYMGIYMLVHMTGGNLAPMMGGFIFKSLNWHWCYHVPAIAAAAMLLLYICSVPETLYSRSVEVLNRPHMSEYQKERIRKRRRSSRQLRLASFTRQFKMLRYPSVAIPALFYAVASGFGNIIFIVSSAILFRKIYHFHAYQIGLLLGLPLTMGALVGEAGAGGFSDWVIRRRAVKREGKRVAEDRLFAMLPGVALLPLGLVLEAYGLREKTHWILPGFGIGLSSAGLQIVTTVTYSYTADCYSRQVAEIGSLLNLGRQIFAFSVGFFAIRFAARWGLMTAWGVFASIELLCFLPVVCLMIKGEQWRETLLPPDWNMDL